MRYVLGMTSSIDSRTGCRRFRELDFVRLVLAVRTLADAGATAHGYLMAPDGRVAPRVRSWQRKYAAVDLVSVLLHGALAAGQGRLRQEKGRDGLGSTTPAPSQPAESSRSLAEAASEEALRAAIRENEPGVMEVPSGTPSPFGVRWDYFGTRDAASVVEAQLRSETARWDSRSAG